MTAPHQTDAPNAETVGGALLEDALSPLPTASEQVHYRRPAPSLPGRLTAAQVEGLWDWARLQNAHAQGVWADLEEAELGPLPAYRCPAAQIHLCVES